MQLDPTRFQDLPLLTRAMAANDCTVSINGLVSDRIMFRPASIGASRWFWTGTGPAMVQAGLAASGETGSLEEVRLRLREAFDGWLTWTLAPGEPVLWHGGPQ